MPCAEHRTRMAPSKMRPLVRTALMAAAFAVLFLGPLSSQAHAQTVAVTTTSDSGPGSLREAIAAVNAGAANVIDMTAVAGTVTLTSPLPAILNAVTINGLGGSPPSIEGSGGSVLLDAGALVTLNGVTFGNGLTKTGSGAVV